VEIRLDGEVAFITGAANGIGRGVAVAIAEAGARVAVADRSREQLDEVVDMISAIGAHVSAHRVDVADPAQVSAAVADASEVHGDVTVLVTAAAIGESVSVEEMSIEQWSTVLDVNLNGTFYCLKAVVPGMRRAGRGRVIFFGSNFGLKGGPESAAYGTAKAGVHGLARCAAIDLAGAGITVNVVAPGPVETDMLWSLPQEWLDSKRRDMPLGRFGTVDEIVPTVLLLASSAGSFYTGATMNVSGGDVMM